MRRLARIGRACRSAASLFSLLKQIACKRVAHILRRDQKQFSIPEYIAAVKLLRLAGETLFRRTGFQRKDLSAAILKNNRQLRIANSPDAAQHFPRALAHIAGSMSGSIL